MVLLRLSSSQHGTCSSDVCFVYTCRRLIDLSNDCRYISKDERAEQVIENPFYFVFKMMEFVFKMMYFSFINLSRSRLQ